jgi:hypothetical protein
MTHVELAASLRETARECDAIAAIVEACPPRDGWEIEPDPEVATLVDYTYQAGKRACSITIRAGKRIYAGTAGPGRDAMFAAECEAMRVALEAARLKVAAGEEGA